MRDLGALLSSEQQRLSETFAERRKRFLGTFAKKAQRKFDRAMAQVLPGHNGPRYRRALNHLAQNVAREELLPWLESEAKHADETFSKVVCRFAEMGNNFIEQLKDTGLPDFAALSQEVGSGRGLQVESHFYFHVMERVAAPASPFLLVGDLLCGLLHLRSGIVSDAGEFLDYLLEVNSARVQSDVEERVRESRRKLEANIKGLLRETMTVAERALVPSEDCTGIGRSGCGSCPCQAKQSRKRNC